MKSKQKHLIAGTIIASSVLGAANLNASVSSLFKFNELGSGSEIRTTLLNHGSRDYNAYLLELSCGEDAKKPDATKKAEDKTKEAKCGEGKCGETKSKDMKADTKAKADTTAVKETKAKEAKCGEGKCGVE